MGTMSFRSRPLIELIINMSTKTMTTQLGDSGKSKSSASWLQRMAANFGFTNAASLRETLENLIREPQEEEGEKPLSPEERLMLLNVLEFGEAKVSEVMIPRADIVAVEENQTVAELLNLFGSVGHSRVPVYRESLDNPTGMVHIKDAIAWATSCGGKLGAHDDSVDDHVQCGDLRAALKTTIESAKLVREALFVPPTMPALALLAKMKSKKFILRL